MPFRQAADALASSPTSAPLAPAGHGGTFRQASDTIADAPVTVTGSAKAVGSGVAQAGLQAAGGAHGDIRDIGRSIVDTTLNAMTSHGIINQGTANGVHNAIRYAYHALDPAQAGLDTINHVSDLVNAATWTPRRQPLEVPSTPAMQAITGTAYTPKNRTERYLKVAGSMLPNAMLGPVAGEGLAAQGASRLMSIVAPTVGSEGARQLVEHAGGDENAQTEASVIGGLAAGAGVAAAPRALAAGEAALGGRVDTAAATAGVNAELARIGVDPATLPPATSAAINTHIANGVRPVDAVHAAIAQTQPVPIPMSKGQMSGQPSEQMTENAALRGADGVGPAAVARGFQQTQQNAIRQNVSQIGADIAGGAPVARGQGGQAVSADLNAAYDAAKTKVNSAYDTARDVGYGAHLPASETPVLGANLRQAVRDYDPATVPAVTRELDRVDTLSAPTAQDLFDTRSRLSNLRASNDGVTAGAAGKAVNALDGYISDAVDKDLFTGDPNAVAAWRNAIGQRRQFGQTFEGNNLVQSLTERSGGASTLKVPPEDAANLIFGRSALGFIGRQGMTRDLSNLRDTLGADSASWNALRAEAWQRIAGAGEGAMEGGTPQLSGAKLATAWNRAKTSDPSVIGTLFTPEERATIDRFVATTQRATTPVRGGDNPSNSAITMRSFLALPFVRTAVAGLHVIPFAPELIGGAATSYRSARTAGATVFAKPGKAGAPKLPLPPVNAMTVMAPALLSDPEARQRNAFAP